MLQSRHFERMALSKCVSFKSRGVDVLPQIPAFCSFVANNVLRFLQP